MAEINNMLALQARAPDIDIGRSMLAAAQVRAAETGNQLTQFNLSQAVEGRNLLQQYGQASAAGDPNAEKVLAARPDVWAKVIETRNSADEGTRKRIDYALQQNAKDAHAILGLPPEEQEAAWREKVETAYRDGRMQTLYGSGAEANYRRMIAGKPNLLQLRNIIQGGLSLENAVAMGQKDEGIKAATDFSKNLGGLFVGDQRPAAQPTGSNSSTYFNTLRVAESGGNDNARARTSSATGRYQFTDGTWRGLAAQHPELQLTPEGRNDPAQQERAIRAFTASNASALADAGIAPTDRNLYLSHFLGSKGAIGFINGMSANPGATGAELAGKAAAEANRSIFFGADGQPLPASAVYSRLTSKFGGENTTVAFKDLLSQAPANASRTPRAGATIAGLPAQKLIPLLLQGAMHPGFPKETRDATMELLKTALAESKPTDEQREYIQYVSQEVEAGRVPKTLFEYKKELKEAGASKVTVDQKGESELAKKLGGGLGEQINEIAKDGITAGDERLMVGRLGQLLEQSGTGTSIAFTNWVREMTGIKLGPKADIAEAANAIVKYMQPRMRVPGSGATSDKDVQIFGQSLPSLLSTPEGKRIIIETLGGMSTSRQARGDIAMRVQMGEITPKEGIEQMRKLGDPFKTFRDWQAVQSGSGGRQPQPLAVPKTGDVVDGFRFKGGNPADAASWEKAQ